MDVQPPVESAFCEESVNKFRQAMDVHSPAVSNLSVRIPSRSSSPRSAAVKSATPKDQLSICSFPPYCPNPKLQLKEILETLKRHISEKYIDILRAFRNYDKRAGGLVLRSQLKQILRTYCIPLTEAQFFDVMKEYNFADKAQINYKEFLEYFASFDKIQQETVIPVEEVPSIIPAEELEVILKHKISQNLSKIIQGMWLFDVNKDGNIQRRELRKIIENYCCALTDVQFKSICNRYDPRNSGLVNYKDFLIRLGINVSRYEHLMPKDIVEKAIKWPLKLSEEEMTKIKLAQIQQRASREGRTDPLLTGLTTDEVFQVLKHKLKSRGHLLERAFKAFDPTDRGFVSLDDFHGALNYVIMPLSDSLFKLILFRLNLLQISPNRIFYRDFLKDYCQPHKLLDEKDESKTDDDLIKHFKRLIPNPEKQLKSIFSSEEQADENKASPYEHIHEKKLKEKLKAYVVRNYQEIGKAIMARDHQQSGLISCEDFKEILDYFCFSLSDIQFQEIVSDFDVYRGSFNYKKFLDLYKRSTDEETEKWIETMNRVVPFKSTESTQLSSKEVEAYLREAVQAKRNTFLRDFTALDYADVGLVKKPDVKLLFDKHAFRMSEHQFEEIWKMFPVNPFNKLIYKKFLEEFGNVTGMNPPTPPESPKVPEEIPYPYRSDSPRSIVTVDMYEERKKPRVRPKTPFPVIKELMNPIKIPQSPSLYKWPERTKVVTAHGVKPGSPINVKDSSLEITVRDRKDDEVTAEDKVWPMSRQQTLMGKEIEESIDKYPPVNPYTVVTTTDIHLQKRILWRWRDIVRKCKLYDKNNKGVIAEENFTEILRKGGIPVNKKDTETQLIQRYGIVSGVPVNYWDFLRKFLLHVGTARSTLSPSELTSLQELRMSMPKPPPLCVRMSASSRSSAQYLLEDLITKHYKDIKKRCEAFDPTDEGVMLGEQLRRILQESGISVNNDDIARELEQQGISNGVSVDYWHFISKNVLHLGKRSAADNIYKRRKLPPARVKVPLGKESAHLNETLLSIRSKVMKNFMNLSRMFYRYDKNMTGLVKSEVFRKFLLKFGVVLKEEGLFSILEYYDPNLTGKIPYADFLRAFVRSA